MKRVFTAKNPGSYGYGWFVTGTPADQRIWHEGSDPGYAAYLRTGKSLTQCLRLGTSSIDRQHEIVFQELMPLLGQRILVLTLSRTQMTKFA